MGLTFGASHLGFKLEMPTLSCASCIVISEISESPTGRPAARCLSRAVLQNISGDLQLTYPDEVAPIYSDTNT